MTVGLLKEETNASFHLFKTTIAEPESYLELKCFHPFPPGLAVPRAG